MLGLQDRDDCLQNEQTHYAEEYVGAHDDPAIDGQGHKHRHRQGSLREDLAHRMRDM